MATPAQAREDHYRGWAWALGDSEIGATLGGQVLADMSGRAALITGAASGIGRASAIAFAAAGASVALVDIDTDGLEETAAIVKAMGQRAEVFTADVADLQAVTTAVEDAAGALGRLDAAHNNAGVPGPYVPLDEYEEDDFMRVLQVDLVGVWRCMRAEIRYMRTQRSGAIVNTSSMLGGAAMPDNSAYIAAKHGVHGLTRAAALELGGTGIRVNAIAPGVTRTRMTSGVSDELLRRVPLARIAEPEEIAAAAVWLCSPAASYITGSVLVADGGWLAG
jgi:A-factor type gamma-butyrolactone 1'-reductase (1S-forming)